MVMNLSLRLGERTARSKASNHIDIMVRKEEGTVDFPYGSHHICKVLIMLVAIAWRVDAFIP